MTASRVKSGMPRPTLASLPLLASFALAACGAPPAVVQPTNTVPTARYTMFPLFVRGSEGMHSASHSSTNVSGALSIAGDRAELVLGFDTFVGFVHCPEEMRTGKVLMMQACAPDDQKNIQSTSRVVMRGSARTQNGALVVSVVGEQNQRDRRIEPHRMTITCRDSFLGLGCAISETNMFGFGVIAPHTMAFLTPGTKRFSITPTDVKDVGLVSGSLAIEGDGAIAITLAVDGGAPTTLPGDASWMDHGISVQAQTSPTRKLGALCAVDGDHLKCEVTGDRSILGKAEHIYSQMLLVPERDLPAQNAPRLGAQPAMHAPART